MFEKNMVVYLPYLMKGDKTNDYVINMIRILEKRYMVTGELAEMIDIPIMIKTKAVILNWVEEQLNNKMKLQLFIYKMCGTKIIWVFHNKFPHETRQGERLMRKNMEWLANEADYILLHSKSSVNYIPNHRRNRRKALYVPHIMYERKTSSAQMDEIRRKYEIKEEDFVFSMFGFLKPYKHYEDGIEAFKAMKLKNAKLIVAGSALNAEYARFLKAICEGNDDIILDIRYIPNQILDAVIEISDVVVLPYDNASSMNSGVMIRAFSNARTVITPNICMAKDIAQYRFIYRYKTDLKGAMTRAYKNGKKINAQMGEMAFEYVKKNNSAEDVSQKLDYILKDEVRRKERRERHEKRTCYITGHDSRRGDRGSSGGTGIHKED